MDEADAEVLEKGLRAQVLNDLGDAEPDLARYGAFLAAELGEALSLWFGRERLASASPGEVRAWVRRDVAEIDQALNRACNAILHHQRFRELEAAWRGLYWLSGSLSADGLTQLKILDCRWSELTRDLERALDFDQSVLFDLIYSQEFGTPGGVPYSLLVGLFEVRHKPTRERPGDDIATLRRLSTVAAAAFSPIVMGAAATLLGVDQMADLDRRASISAVFRAAEYNRYNSFRGLSDARFIGLVAPRILMRAPYRGRQAGDCGFVFHETIADASNDQVWCVGALALAQICFRAFSDFRWLAAIRGTISDELAGGVVVDLAASDFATDRAGAIVKVPLEVNLTETLERELSEAGVITIRRCKDTPYCAVNNLPSLHRPKGAYVSEIARANEQLGAMINYILCVARFAHYIKVIARDWIGSYYSPEECEGRLAKWISSYCAAGDDLSYELRARYPLQAAQIRVAAVPGRPGSLECTARLKPHLQLDQAISEFQLVTLVQGVERQF